MELLYKNKTYSVELQKLDSAFSSVINGEKKIFSANLLNPNTISIIDGNSRTLAYAADDDNNIYVNIDGQNFVFQKPKEEESEFGGDNGISADKQIVKPPMPGSIVQVVAEKGKKVSEGAPLIIIEAMKMETTIYANIDGIVTEVNVSAGEQVDSDKVLMIVEKENIES